MSDLLETFEGKNVVVEAVGTRIQGRLALTRSPRRILLKTGYGLVLIRDFDLIKEVKENE